MSRVVEHVEAGTPAHESFRFRMGGRLFARPDRAMVLVLAIAAVKLVATMAVAGRYGWHRDELYYLACARHLSWGYVDFPPVTPLLAHLDTVMFGVSLTGLRLLSVLAGTAVVVLAARMARAMGGGTGAQILAAFSMLLNPLFLGGNLLFQTVSFDQLTWAIVLYLAIRLLNGADPKLWLLVGVVFGIGLETKYLIAALGLGLAAGFLFSPARRHLRTPWPWLGAAIALAFLAPNLVWQAQHGWASLTYIRTHSGDTGSRPQFVAETVLLVGPLLGLPLVILGAIQLWRHPLYRALAVTCAAVVLILFASNGKSYYAGPIYPLLLAAGSIRAVSLFRDRRRIGLVIVAVLTVLTMPLVPIGLPVLPARAAIDLGFVSTRKDYTDMFGWREIAQLTARVYYSLPPSERAHAVIWGMNYGEAGAIDLYGPAYGLPPAIDNHLTYFYWKPAHVDDRTVIVVGDDTLLPPLFADIRHVGTVRNVYGIHNDEWGTGIYVCRRPRVPLDHAWATLQIFN